MAKLLNRKTIQYIKQGQVLYAQFGNHLEKFIEDSDINKPFTEDELLKKFIFYSDDPSRTKFPQFLKKYFIYDNNSKKYYRIGSQKDIELNSVPVKDYYNYYYYNGALYKKQRKRASRSSEFVKVDKDIKDNNNRTIIPSTDPSDKRNAEILAEATRNGDALPHPYLQGEVEYYNVTLKDGKTKKWAARYINPTNGQKPGWWWVAEGSTGYDRNKVKKQFKNGQWVPEEKSTAPENTNTALGNDNTNQDNSGAAPEGPPTSNFEALNVETDRRTIVPSIISQPQVSQASPSMRLLPKVKPVARPKDMPLMNRSDVRYTINDVTGDSPYFSSDIELVNGLAKTPDDNMFKQALMNRLGMDKWDNSTALNRLNYLGIKGNIGGSDRKRLRNLINKGTTIEGTIRKKQGGKLKLIKRYG